MKKILLITFLAISSATPTYADGGHGGGWGHGGGGWRGDWVVPALIGGALTYELTRPQTVYVQPAPVYAPSYPPYYYPYPYVVAMPTQPPVYIEQSSPQSVPQQAAAPQATNYWYHCDKPEGYYPYIKECLGGWQKVVPSPPPL